MENENWDRFKAEKITEWLKPMKLDPKDVESADKDAEAILPYLDHKEKGWVEEEGPKGIQGKRGEYWVRMMLDDLMGGKGVFGPVDPKHYRSFNIPREVYEKHCESLDPRYGKDHVKMRRRCLPAWDLYVVHLGTIEVKTSPVGQDCVNIKRTPWDRDPSTHLVALKTMDDKMKTFSLMGFLYGHEVYKLQWNPAETFAKSWNDYYSAPVEDLRSAKEFLELVLEVSKHNPELKQKRWYRT